VIKPSSCLLLLVLLATSSDAVAPSRIGNFATLRDALTKGATVRAVVEYGRCQLVEAGDPRLRPAPMGGFTVDAWRSAVGSDGSGERVSVILSGEQLMVGPRGGVLRQLVRLEVFHDDRVTVELRHLDPDTAEVLSLWRLATTLDRGDEGAAAFFRLE
jgi:hypothetical protein